MVAKGLLLAPALESTPFVATHHVAENPLDAISQKKTIRNLWPKPRALTKNDDMTVPAFGSIGHLKASYNFAVYPRIETTPSPILAITL